MIKPRRSAMARIIVIFAVLVHCMGVSAAEKPLDDEDGVSGAVARESRIWDRLSFLLSPEFMSVSNSTTGETLTGLGLAVGGLYAISQDWGAGASVRQSFSMSGGFSNLFTAFDLRVTYAFTGNLLGKRREVSVQNAAVYEETQSASGGLRGQFCVSEYLFNSSVAAVPFTGFGIALYYEFPTESKMAYVFGGRFDQLSNGPQTINPKVIFGGVSLRF